MLTFRKHATYTLRSKERKKRTVKKMQDKPRTFLLSFLFFFLPSNNSHKIVKISRLSHHPSTFRFKFGSLHVFFVFSERNRFHLYHLSLSFSHSLVSDKLYRQLCTVKFYYLWALADMLLFFVYVYNSFEY